MVLVKWWEEEEQATRMDIDKLAGRSIGESIPHHNPPPQKKHARVEVDRPSVGSAEMNSASKKPWAALREEPRSRFLVGACITRALCLWGWC
jgi:hypothetical protein